MAFWDFVDPAGLFHSGNILSGLGISPNDKSDRENYTNQLQSQLGQLGANAPNLSELYKLYQSNVLGSVKKPSDLGGYFDKAKQNLNYNMSTQVGDAQSSAGALAASRGFANPSGFVSNAGQQVRNSFVPQFGQLESDKAMATSRQQDEFNRYFTQLLTQLGQGQIGAAQNDFSNQMNIFGLKNNMTQNYDPYTGWDKTINFASNLLPSVISGGM